MLEKKVCVDKKCHLKNKKCKFTSLPIKFNYITKCHWKKSKNEKTKTCCRYFQKCVGRKCKKSNRTCKVVQHLTRQKRKGCYWKRFKRGRRQRCCSYHVFCKFDKKSHKKFCRRLFKKCKWVGPTIYWTSKLSCKWKRKAKNQRQKRCCKKVSKCRGKECKQMKLTCEWRGAVISRHTKKKM